MFSDPSFLVDVARVFLCCSRTVELLAAECGCPLEHPIAVKFRSYVMDGDWDEVLNVLLIYCLFTTGLQSLEMSGEFGRCWGKCQEID